MADDRTTGTSRPRPPGLGRKDLTDGREPYDWEPRFDPEATRLIRQEAIYVGCVLLIAAAALGGVLYLRFCSSFRHCSIFSCLAVNLAVLRPLAAWLGGTVGGVLFTIKWLYHSVAKGGWHIERRLWRVFTPHVSGALACMVVVLISGGIFPVLNAHSVDSLGGVVGISFLVGYFSDHAIAKLTEVAETLFGRRMNADPPRVEEPSQSDATNSKPAK